MSSKLDIMIAGAGIGGLTAAACLMQAGHRVRLFEQASKLGEVGAGLQISANGFKVMRHIGVDKKLAAAGVKPLSYVFRIAETGEEVNRFELAEAHEAANGAPYYQLHRADLHAALVERVRQLDSNCVTLNAAVSEYEERETRVDLILSDGRRFSGDVLIGADGIKSAISAQAFGQAPADFTGDVAWRLIIPAARLPKDHIDRVMTVWLGPSSHAVMYYLRNKELVNFVGLKESDTWQDESWTSKGDWSELKSDFSTWHDEVQVVLDAVDKDACYRWALFNRKPIDNWAKGRVALLGDASHPTLPYLAQGAVMAIEDSAVLARCLDEVSDPVEALKLYSAVRAPRAARVVNESSANQKKFRGSIADLRQRFIGAEIGGDRNGWLYGYDPLTVKLSQAEGAQS